MLNLNVREMEISTSLSKNVKFPAKVATLDLSMLSETGHYQPKKDTINIWNTLRDFYVDKETMTFILIDNNTSEKIQYINFYGLICQCIINIYTTFFKFSINPEDNLHVL